SWIFFGISSFTPTRRCLIGNCCKRFGVRIMAIRSTTCACSSRIFARRSNLILNARNTSLPSPGLVIGSTARFKLYKIFMASLLLLYAFSPTIRSDGSKWAFLSKYKFAERDNGRRNCYRPTHGEAMALTDSWKLLSFSPRQRQRGLFSNEVALF